ncbi:MAG: hypothetical protein ACRC3H_06555 [Lachnospiraceae bacterium]
MSMSDYFEVATWVFLIISAFLILAMLYSLRKKDDERRKLIVMKAAMYTFYIVIGILIANIIGISIVMIGQGGITNPISLLNTIAIIYFIELAYWKREYGD